MSVLFVCYFPRLMVLLYLFFVFVLVLFSVRVESALSSVETRRMIFMFFASLVFSFHLCFVLCSCSF